MVPADSDKIPRVSSYSGSHWVTSQFRVQDLHLLRLAFQCHSTIVLCTVSWSYNPSLAGLGFSPFARRYLGNHSYFLFLQVLRCFNSLGCLLTSYLIRIWITEIFISAGFPHSDTCASLTVYVSTQRFAVFCVLLLLYMPRHPPYALLHLITLLENC